MQQAAKYPMCNHCHGRFDGPGEGIFACINWQWGVFIAFMALCFFFVGLVVR